MKDSPFPSVLWHLGPIDITATWLSTIGISVVLAALSLLVRSDRTRLFVEIVYEQLERQIRGMVSVEPGPLVGLVLSLWLFIGCANLVGLVPGLRSPTGDLSLAAALAFVSFVAGHVMAYRAHGVAYLKQYLAPVWFMLPFNVIGELSRTLALCLRLFGNALSGNLIAAILVYLAGFLLPVPMMLLSVLTGVVQAYIFGVLALVFAASAVEACRPRKEIANGRD